MITQLILSPVFMLINWIVVLFPPAAMASEALGIQTIFSLLEKGFIVFPYDLFVFCVTNISVWLTIQMGWAIIEWCYKKLPGVN